MKKRNNGFLLAAPALLGFLVFYFAPFLITCWYSVSFGIGKREFVGLVNYQEIFENEMFLLAVKNTCRYMLVTVPVTLGAAVGLSVVLRHVARGVTFLRLSFLYPMIMPIASIVLAVQFFCGDSGFLNRVLTLTGMQGADWLHTSAAFWILCILYFWRFIGYYVLIYFAKLQMIPGEYYELMTTCGFEKNGARRSFGWDMEPIGGLFSEAAIHHSGWSGQNLWIDPESGCFFIMLTNRSSTEYEACKFMRRETARAMYEFLMQHR